MIKIWLFSRKKREAPIDTSALVEQLLYRLDEQDRQAYQLQRRIEDQTKQIERLIKRVDQATGRGAA